MAYPVRVWWICRCARVPGKHAGQAWGFSAEDTLGEWKQADSASLIANTNLDWRTQVDALIDPETARLRR